MLKKHFKNGKKKDGLHTFFLLLL